MSSFNENTFMIAGSAIAMFGVGLYIYDTRKDRVVNAYNQYRQPKNNYAAAPGYNEQGSHSEEQGVMMAGSRKNRKRNFRKKTKKNH
jgi:hypothetical protein